MILERRATGHTHSNHLRRVRENRRAASDGRLYRPKVAPAVWAPAEKRQGGAWLAWSRRHPLLTELAAIALLAFAGIVISLVGR